MWQVSVVLHGVCIGEDREERLGVIWLDGAQHQAVCGEAWKVGKGGIDRHAFIVLSWVTRCLVSRAWSGRVLKCRNSRSTRQATGGRSHAPASRRMRAP